MSLLPPRPCELAGMLPRDQLNAFHLQSHGQNRQAGAPISAGPSFAPILRRAWGWIMHLRRDDTPTQDMETTEWWCHYWSLRPSAAKARGVSSPPPSQRKSS